MAGGETDFDSRSAPGFPPHKIHFLTSGFEAFQVPVIKKYGAERASTHGCFLRWQTLGPVTQRVGRAVEMPFQIFSHYNNNTVISK